jgi:hypothetical protein
MGEYRDHHNRRCFTPDNTSDILYLRADSGYTIEDLRDYAATHFQHDHLQEEDIQIGAEYIHTECLGYDRYDPDDYTLYLTITLTPSGRSRALPQQG